MLVTAFGMFAIPFCKQALLLTGLMSSIGVSMGVLDTGKSTLEHVCCVRVVVPSRPPLSFPQPLHPCWAPSAHSPTVLV